MAWNESLEPLRTQVAREFDEAARTRGVPQSRDRERAKVTLARIERAHVRRRIVAR
jgi:hypothetical protein